MKNLNIINKITQGMYVLTTNGGGCIVDAVSQVSGGDFPLIAVSVMKKNYTNELLHKNKKFALSVLDIDVDPNIIKTFGFNSSRNINKFENITTTEVEDIEIINGSLGYMVCEIVDSIDNDTHTLFIGKVVEADVFDGSEPMSYKYYQEHKYDLLNVTTANGKTAWICTVCGFIYYGDVISDDFKCPVCGVNKDFFEKQ